MTTPGSTAPIDPVHGVPATVGDACGIAAPAGQAVFRRPADRVDSSHRGYRRADHCFCVTLSWGREIVLSHSGLVGDSYTPSPSWGRIAAASNLAFLFDVLDCLAGEA